MWSCMPATPAPRRGSRRRRGRWVGVYAGVHAGVYAAAEDDDDDDDVGAGEVRTAPSRALSRLMGDVALGDALRDARMRRAIPSLVADMERAPPVSSSTASPLIAGSWRLRYTTSAGTLGAVAGWEALAGGVTGVEQRVDRMDPTSRTIDITNVVTVSLPGISSGVSGTGASVRITQRFEAAVQSGTRLSARLGESVVDVVRDDAEVSYADTTRGDAATPLFRLPAQLAAAALVSAAGRTEAPGVVASVKQPGVELQPPKRQLVTYVDDTWRVTRDDASFSLYSRVA